MEHRTFLSLAVALVFATAWPSAGSARSWQVDDLFHLEDVGQVEFNPTGRYLLVERQRPRAEMTRFDMDHWGEIARGAPMVFDLSTGGPPHPLLSVEPSAGYALGSISPDGQQVVVYRLRDHSFELGVAQIATGRADWLGVTPELGRLGRAVEWLSPTRLIAVVRPDRSLPLNLRMGFEAPQILSDLSRKQAEGREPSVIVVGSGRYRDLRPQASPDQLIEVDLLNHAEHSLASGEFLDLAVSHDRRFVALLTNGADIQYPDTQALKVGTPAFRRSLTLVDLRSGRVSQPAPGFDLLTHLLAWAPASDRLLVYGRKGPGAWADGRLLLVDALQDAVEPRAGIEPDVLLDISEAPVVEADWDGEDPLIFGHAAGQAGGRSDWFRLKGSSPQNLTSALTATPHLLAIGTHGLVYSSGDSFWRIDRGGRATKLPSPPEAEPLTLLSPDRGVRFLFNDRPRRDWIWIRNPQSGGQAVLRLGDALSAPLQIAGADRIVAADQSGARIVTVARDAHGVLTLGLHSVVGTVRPLLRLNTALEDIEPAGVHPIHHLSGVGSSVTSWLYLPPNLKPGEHPPLLVWAYPGEDNPSPPSAETPGMSAISDSLANAQILTAQGYAVLYASTPDRPDLADPADGFEPDILRAVDAAGATGLVDTARLAFWGHSYGGYAALELATRTSRFRAIIASAAISDMASVTSVFAPFVRFRPSDGLWIDSGAGWLEDGQAQLHTQAWKNPERYVRDSPVFSAGAITTPLLLISGGMDTVPMQQREEMFSDLYRQDKDVVLASYFGEGHMIYSPANLKDLYARVFKFLNDNLGSPRQAAAS